MDKRNVAIVAFAVTLAAISGPAFWALVEAADKPKSELLAEDPPKPKAGEDVAAQPDDFAAVMKRMTAAKPEIAEKHAKLLAKRYEG